MNQNISTAIGSSLTGMANLFGPMIGAKMPFQNRYTAWAERPNCGDSLVLTNNEMAGLVMAIAEQRDRSAYRQVFDHFAPRVKSYLMGLKLASEPADDVLQEVMIAVWNKAASYRPDKAAVSTWIFTIARNKHIDRIRREKYSLYDSGDIDIAAAEATEPDVADEQLLTMQRKRAVQAALATLPEDQKLVISMSFLKEMAHAEIAAALDLPLGTVKSRIRLGFQRLRKELGEVL